MRLTRVSSRHSQKCITLLKLRTELKTFFFKILRPIFSEIFFWTNLNCYRYLTVTAFDLIPTLRAGPEYRLSADIHCHKAGIKLPYRLAIYLICQNFVNQLLLVTRSCGEPLSKSYGLSAIKRQNEPIKCLFWTTSKNFNR